jgi:hypothetical protein
LEVCRSLQIIWKIGKTNQAHELISSGGPLAQHCCVSKPLGLAGLLAPGERPTDMRTGAGRQPTALAARLASMLTQQCSFAPAAMAAKEGVLRRRDCGTDSSGTRTSARRPHRRGVDGEVARLGSMLTVVSEL